MRFERLHLAAFGPFSGHEIDLSGGAPGGLHIVFGPNEAGKSTSLRAVRNFLFGMPQRSPDAHLHPSAKLRVEAEISEGERRLSLTRIKRRKDDLLDGEGAVVEESPLPALLGYLDEGSFCRRFGLDQEELEKGAEALLGGSEQGLFAAGTAGAEVRQVLDSLKRECEQLYLPRGKVPLLNRQLAEYEQATRQAKRAERPPEKWLEQERAYKQAAGRAKHLKAERIQVRADLRRLNRLKAVISDLSDWQRLQEERSRLVDVADLPADAAKKREEASLALSEARVEAARIKDEIQAFEEELAALPAESSLTQVDAVQLDLTARIGRALSARKDMPKREAQLLEVQRQLAVLLRDLGHKPEDGRELSLARSVLIGEEVTGTVKRLLTQRGALHAEVTQAERHLGALSVESRQLQEQSEETPDSAFLELLEARLSEASQAAGVESELTRLQDEAVERRAQVGRVRQRWELQAPISEQELARLEALATERTRTQEWERERKELVQKVEQAAGEIRSLESSLRAKGELDLPTEERLEEVRRERDLCLQRALEQRELVQELPHLIRAADELADRMRREADRLAELSALTHQIEHLNSEKELAERRAASLEHGLREERERFEATLEELEIRRAVPLEATSQLVSDLRRLLDDELRLSVLRERAESRKNVLQRIKAQLFEVLEASTDPHELSRLELGALIALGSRKLQQGQKANERSLFLEESRRKLSKAQDAAVARLDDARNAFAAWQARWARAVAPLGLQPDASVERAQEVLSTLERVFRWVDSAEQYEKRIAGMQRDTEALATDVRRVAAAHLPALLSEEPVDAAVRLQEAIVAAHRVSEERGRIRRTLAARRDKLSQVELRVETAHFRLEHLRKQANAKTVEEMVQVEALARKKAEVTLRLEELSERLRVAADGTPIDELLVEARPWKGSVGRLASEIDDLDARNTDLEQELREAEAEAEGMRLGLQTYRSEDVALARQLAMDKASAARQSIRNYLVKRAAHTLLEREVAHYAARFRGPLADRAGALFERITLGKYSGLSVGVGEKTLRCISEGLEKEVHQLSRGTRAQLYFVLRLSSLQAYFQEHPRVPLIFDDLFVDFDDDRATVAFELLSEMAQYTQVLYFTHLARDVEKAHDAVSSNRLFCHTIGVS